MNIKHLNWINKNTITSQCLDCQAPISELYASTWKYLSTFRCYECYSEKKFEDISIKIEKV